MLKIIKGNLFDTKCQIIAHGVNCRGAFGSGVAGQIAKRFPQARLCYMTKHYHQGWELGQVQYVDINYALNEKINQHMPDFGSTLVIANMATQFTYGKTGVHINYDAVEQCLTGVINFADSNNWNIAMPWVGCGLAGGDKKKVLEILNKCLVNFNVLVEVWEP